MSIWFGINESNLHRQEREKSRTFGTEDEGKKLKEKLKAQGVKDAKWEW
jgi:hypothetical protein